MSNCSFQICWYQIIHTLRYQIIHPCVKLFFHIYRYQIIHPCVKLFFQIYRYQIILCCVNCFFFFRYGYTNLRHVSSLVSGVAIFFLGTGFSIYHGIQGILHPNEMGSLIWVCIRLSNTFLYSGYFYSEQWQLISSQMDLSYLIVISLWYRQ